MHATRDRSQVKLIIEKNNSSSSAAGKTILCFKIDVSHNYKQKIYYLLRTTDILIKKQNI